ncbi:MerR family transcriptional regulator [Levilactobacillus bambusae]|uniref:MerR family transcriptional regulator n=1 Tax=Levilactobacillus bambusae TaxID=2024736 RepID=A0A2V1MZ75_9LACO|nr:MerR family transcriptional regulator [Levilactobacillus bambusae]PWG00321.1 MerR family transcriptional regulator [Levilactobacillus bambusae]
MAELKVEFLDRFNHLNLIFGIGQVSKITGVSPRKLRYWEQQGYIASIDNSQGGTRQFDLKNLMTVMGIAQFIDAGYTLQAAVKRAHALEAVMPLLKRFLSQNIQSIELDDDHQGTGRIDFGVIDSHPHQHLYGEVRDDQTRFVIEED